MDANDARIASATAGEDRLVEVAFPAWPAPAWAVRAVETVLPAAWGVDRRAAEAAAVVAGLVGVPAVIAVGTVVAAFALTWAVLAAPAVAAALVWAAWRANRSARPRDAVRRAVDAPSS